jgi:hypothetical protein
MATTNNVSIAVPEGNVSLLAGALLTEPTGTDDGMQATFELKMALADFNALFTWSTAGSANVANFATGASALFKNCCRQQLYLFPDATKTRANVDPSLATHFSLVKSVLPLSSALSSISKCNMVEEKILAVSYDLFNSVNAFTLFEPKSRLLLSKDYYTRGVNALNYIAAKMNTSNATLASAIVNRVVSVREVNMTESTFSAFVAGDELTFNVIAVSSKSQYDILQNANVDKNLADRSYKFKIVATDEEGVDVYGEGSTSTNVVAPVTLSSKHVMGHLNAGDYDSILTKITTTLTYNADQTSIYHYVDQFNTTYTNSYSTEGANLSDGITKQF